MKTLGIWGVRIAVCFLSLMIIFSIFLPEDLKAKFAVGSFAIAFFGALIIVLSTFLTENNFWNWIFFSSFFLVFIGLIMAFIPAFIFNFPLTNIYVKIGGVSFMIGVVLMMISGIVKKYFSRR